MKMNKNKATKILFALRLRYFIEEMYLGSQNLQSKKKFLLLSGSADGT